MAETFDNFMHHKRSFKYIQNTTSIDLGNGYAYISKPISPMLKEFTLKFTGFRYYFNPDGTIDYETNKNKNNMGTLCAFYETMNMCESFIYNDVQFGSVVVRFSEPLNVPETSGPFAAVADFEIVLKEVSI